VEAIIKTLEGGIITKTLLGGCQAVVQAVVASSRCSRLLEHRLLLYLGNEAFLEIWCMEQKVFVLTQLVDI